jgi:hypothetical protein
MVPELICPFVMVCWCLLFVTFLGLVAHCEVKEGLSEIVSLIT